MPDVLREMTPGNGCQRWGTPEGRVTPRVLDGDHYKRMMGVCMNDGCCKIDGHDGLCSG